MRIVVLGLLLVTLVGKPGLAQSLDQDLDQIRQRYGLPALAAAIVSGKGPAEVTAVGLRRLDKPIPVTPADHFHLGSCTKAMTATLLAVLVERGQLGWEMTLAEGLPGLAEEMDPPFRQVTLRQLLTHRSGLPNRSWPAESSLQAVRRLPGTPRQQRLALVRKMLSEPPAAEPGSKYIYSNVGYTAAAVIAEEQLDTAWETLMRQLIFEPLQMNSAGFGAMGTAARIDQPRQHRQTPSGWQPVEPSAASDNPPSLGPGGTVHASLADWGRFVQAHLQGACGQSGLLRDETFRTLHTPAAGEDYAFGWSVAERTWADGVVLTHAGSNTMNYAVVWIAPQRNLALLAACNAGGDDAAKACDEAIQAALREWQSDMTRP